MFEWFNKPRCHNISADSGTYGSFIRLWYFLIFPGLPIAGFVWLLIFRNY